MTINNPNVAFVCHGNTERAGTTVGLDPSAFSVSDEFVDSLVSAGDPNGAV